MSIRIKKEPASMSQHGALERCAFCGATTKYWHTPSNTPVCPACAATGSVIGLNSSTTPHVHTVHEAVGGGYVCSGCEMRFVEG